MMEEGSGSASDRRSRPLFHTLPAISHLQGIQSYGAGSGAFQVSRITVFWQSFMTPGDSVVSP